MDVGKILKKIELLESHAQLIIKECHETRALLEAHVSTSAKKSANSTIETSLAAARAVAKRKAFIEKKFQEAARKDGS